MMTRMRHVQERPQPVSTEEAKAIFGRWLDQQITVRRAGKRSFLVTMNSQGEITAVEGQEPPKRLA